MSDPQEWFELDDVLSRLRVTLEENVARADALAIASRMHELDGRAPIGSADVFRESICIERSLSAALRMLNAWTDCVRFVH